MLASRRSLTCFSEGEGGVVSGVLLHTNVSVDEIGAQQVHCHAINQRPRHLTQNQRAGPVAQRQPDGQTETGSSLRAVDWFLKSVRP